MRDLDKIIAEDNARRAARELAEMEAFIAAKSAKTDRSDKPYLHANTELVKGIGMVCPPMCSKASQDNWKRGMAGRTKGFATDANNRPLTKEPSMRVIKADGTETIVPVTRKGATHIRKNTRSTSQVAKVPEAIRFHLKPIQDYSA